MPAPLGLIVGESVTTVVFRVPREHEVYVGDILVAEGNEGRLFFLRVVNVKHGADAAGPDWLPRVAGNMLVQRRERGEAGMYADGDDRLYKMGVAVPLGAKFAGEFRKSKTLPPHFAPVRRASADDYAFLADYMGDLEVGHLRSGEETVAFPVGIDGGKSFPYHVGVFATTGMGKSNLMKVLAASCMAAGRYGLLLVDPHGEYVDGGGADRKGLKHHPAAARNLVVYSARDLKGPHNKLRLSSHEIEIQDLRNLFDFSPAQVDFLEAARHRYGKAWFTEVGEKDESVLLAEVPGKFFEGTVAVVKRKVRRLVKNGLVHGDDKVTATRPVLEALRKGKVVLVDTGGLLEAEELLVSTVLARAVFEENKALFGDPEFDRMAPILIVQEEAQRVLGQTNGSQNVFAQIAREGRKFKTGVCAVTQQPKLLNKEVISQFNTLFILGLADKRDRDILQDSAKQDVSQLENEIQMLMPGECLITSPYAPFAIPAKVHLYEEHVERAAKAAPAEGAKARLDAGFY